jgi:hypothetical protein
MAAGFTEWTLLPHEPIEKLTENLWRVEGKMPGGNKRVMTVARLADGRLLMHNAIALEEELMAELDAFGELAGILVPNAFHRQDAFIMKARYPNAKVYAPGASRAAVAKAVAVDGTYDDVPTDATVQCRHLEGFPKEGVLSVTSNDGVTQVYCDSVLHSAVDSRFPFSFLLAPLGRPAVPRATRWLFTKNNAAFGEDLRKLAAVDGLKRIIVGHGPTTDTSAADALRLAAGDCG